MTNELRILLDLIDVPETAERIAILYIFTEAFMVLCIVAFLFWSVNKIINLIRDDL